MWGGEDSNKIRKVVIASGVVTTLAGSGSTGSADGTGTAASFTTPAGITTDGTNLYVTDGDQHVIRKIVIDNGTVTTLAGTVGASGTTDGTGSNARFTMPFGITTDGTNLYVADKSSHLIRKVVIDNGTVTTLAGTGQAGNTDDTGTNASFSQPRGITTDGINLYVADNENHRIRKIVISSGVVTTIAGSSSGAVDATGTSARFRQPWGITTDGKDLYVADSYNYLIRKID